MKTHQGLKKRFKVTKPKKRQGKIVRQRKGMGSKHLKTKKSNARKRRIRQSAGYDVQSRNMKKTLKQLS